MAPNPENSEDERVFDGTSFRCRVNYARGHNSSAPTIVNLKTNLHRGDLFVINLSDDGNQKLLMEVDEERSSASPHPEIIIDESIRRTFSVISFMNNYHHVHKVAKRENFALYLVEVQVKEQYLSRGDMWRFSRRLVNSAVYLRKQLEIFGMRATVYGLWIDKEPFRVSSGYVTKDTKIVFRSLSTCCTLFLQMSKEMWEFDHQGDTFYEKAVDGFLFDLFTRWRHMSCQHDVTMTLFSRVFYDAKSIEDFPVSLRDHINQDHRKRFYEDFYRVIYQNERYDDWLPRLAKIKQVLVNYKEDLVTYHKKQLPKEEAEKMPNGTISCAADGNFLETLNLSSSVFERHFVDRAFDRLGQMSVLITPGAGVFEVDRVLMNMTKQRVLDNGLGSDLVCLGEQPLFAVPMFKFFKLNPATADDYQIPHWMNLSYYHSSTAPSCFQNYIPRLPFDTTRIKTGDLDAIILMNSLSEETFTKPPQMNMEEYDNSIFTNSSRSRNDKSSHGGRLPCHDHRSARRRNATLGPKTTSCIDEEESVPQEPKGLCILPSRNSIYSTVYDDPRLFNANVKDDIVLSTSQATSASVIASQAYANTCNTTAQILFSHSQTSHRLAKSAETHFLQSNQSNKSPTRPRALNNPFAPASIRIPMVPGRRRWAHTFPIGPDEIPWHFHHLRKREGQIKPKMVLNTSTCGHLVLPGTSKRVIDGFISKRINQHSKTNSDFSSRPKRIVSPSHFDFKREANGRKDSATEDIRPNTTGSVGRKPPYESVGRSAIMKKDKKEVIIWGPTGVEPWSALMTTGIDWKSLTIPASLPNTFDVVPPEEDLRRDYTQNPYELIVPLPSIQEYEKKRKPLLHMNGQQDKSVNFELMERRKLVFDEFIDQRLSQGFQMIPNIPPFILKLISENIRRVGHQETEENCLLSIGRIYHTISLAVEDNPNQETVVICVQQYKPLYVHQPKGFTYRYRFQCPDSSSYDPASYDLQVESLESFQWNNVDNVISTHGQGDRKLTDTPKYWRARLVLMPVTRDYTVKSIESGQTKCDSRQEMSHEDFFFYVEHFVRFLVMLNKLSRCRTNGNELIHRPLDPLTGLKRTDHPKRSSKHPFTLKTFKLADIMSEDKNAIDEFKTLLRDDHQGLHFVKDAVLPECSFIAIEAIWWSIEHCEEIKTEADALIFFQFLFHRDYVRHCCHHEAQFRFGFFLYYLVTEKTKDFLLECNEYAEVEFHQTQTFVPSMDYEGFAACKPMRLLPTMLPRQQTASKIIPPAISRVTISPSTISKQPLIPFVNESKTTSSILVTRSTGVKRICNVDVDSNNISDRREWASAEYHAYYNPHCLFEIEIRWLVATCCLLGDLITKWSQRTGAILGSNQISFHLIPIPCDPFAEFDPLRGPIYIKVDSSCLNDHLGNLPKKDQMIQMNIFQELIVKRYGFILNSCVNHEGENIYYVHISGGMLVYIISEVYNVHCNARPSRVASTGTIDGSNTTDDYGFYWCWNFCLGKKWRSCQTGEEKYQDIMLADFRAFCANDKNRLLHFWNEVNEKATQILKQKQTKS